MSSKEGCLPDEAYSKVFRDKEDGEGVSQSVHEGPHHGHMGRSEM